MTGADGVYSQTHKVFLEGEVMTQLYLKEIWEYLSKTDSNNSYFVERVRY